MCETPIPCGGGGGGGGGEGGGAGSSSPYFHLLGGDVDLDVEGGQARVLQEQEQAKKVKDKIWNNSYL